MSTTLTAGQAAALHRVPLGRWADAETIGEHPNTLRALAARGLVDVRTPLGTTRRDQPRQYRLNRAGLRLSTDLRLAARRAARAEAAATTTATAGAIVGPCVCTKMPAWRPGWHWSACPVRAQLAAASPVEPTEPAAGRVELVRELVTLDGIAQALPAGTWHLDNIGGGVLALVDYAGTTVTIDHGQRNAHGTCRPRWTPCEPPSGRPPPTSTRPTTARPARTP